jgi:hypothetical protein
VSIPHRRHRSSCGGTLMTKASPTRLLAGGSSRVCEVDMVSLSHVARSGGTQSFLLMHSSTCQSPLWLQVSGHYLLTLGKKRSLQGQHERIYQQAYMAIYHP